MFRSLCKLSMKGISDVSDLRYSTGDYGKCCTANLVFVCSVSACYECTVSKDNIGNSLFHFLSITYSVRVFEE